MKNPLLTRVAIIFFLAVLLLVPLMAISGKIGERRSTRSNVFQELAATGVGVQQLAGPVLIQPCTETYVEQTKDSGGQLHAERRTRDCSLTYLPDDLRISGALTIEDRHRGIYAARFYVATLDLNGEFNFPSDSTEVAAASERRWGQPVLQLRIADVRGIRNQVTLSWSGDETVFAPGLAAGASGNGIHALVESDKVPIHGRRAFSLRLELQGMERIAFVPSASRTVVNLLAPWPHPSFFGHHLPDQRSLTDKQFQASWRVSALASDAPEILVACARSKCDALADKTFGVAMIDPVDVYLQSTRALNYAFLFVGLTFAAFLTLEILLRLIIHPAQYLLVGVALVLFYLLLFSLSEHVDFSYAYVVAATACVALLTYYSAHILRSAARGIGFGGALTLLYGALYVLLRSEDYALLLGSLLIFGLLAALMIATRKLDWYGIADSLGPRVARS